MQTCELKRSECLDALRSVSHGQVAISSGALPAIEPVKFIVESDSIVFGVAAGTRLAAATDNAVVGFQADSRAGDGVTEWSVLVVGLARRVIDPSALIRLRAFIPTPWDGPVADYVVRIQIRNLEGKRFLPAAGGQPVSLAGITR